MINIPNPDINWINNFNEVKPPEVSEIKREKIVVRFHDDYINSKCWINQLNKAGSLKKIVNLLKDLTGLRLADSSLSQIADKYNCLAISESTNNEYKMFNKFQFTESVWEFKMWWTVRVFWFFIWWIDPSFNIILISNGHLKTNKK